MSGYVIGATGRVRPSENILEPRCSEPAVRLLLTPNEAARALSVSPRTLWSLTHDGKIPFVRIGRLVRYSPGDLQAWIDSQKQSTCA